MARLTHKTLVESGYKGFGYGSLIIGLILTVTGISMDGDFFKYLAHELVGTYKSGRLETQKEVHVAT